MPIPYYSVKFLNGTVGQAKLSVKGELGGVSVYGLGCLPGTLYYEQRIRLLD